MTKKSALLAFALSTSFLAGGCKDDGNTGGGQSQPAKPATPAATAPAAATGSTAGDHPNQVTLGQTTANGLAFKAMQDEPIKAGGEGAFDLSVTGYPAGGKPKAVRFWVGLENGEGSVKAKAEEETPDNWHTHVEIPGPLPPASKFWAEVEPATGEKFKVSFELKR